MPRRLLPALVLGLCVSTARAVVPGGGPSSSDCVAVWDGVTATRGANTVACRDGDPACDADATTDGACTFGVGVCVLAAGIDGCNATAVEALTTSRLLGKAGKLVRQPLSLPTTPATAPACGSAALVRLPLRGKSQAKPSRRMKLAMRATGSVGGARRRDVDRLLLQCLPNEGQGECPANAAGGPRELRLVAADAGTDLDNGWAGFAHNFPIVGASTLRLCLSGCDPSTSPECAISSPTGRGTINPTFGPPLPLFVLGAGTCLVNEYEGSITGAANLATGAITADLTLSTEVWIAPAGLVCPQCSGDAPGDTGVCLAGPDQGRACRVEGTVLVGEADNKIFKLSSSCRPEGTLGARLKIPLHVTTAGRVLEGALPCPGQLKTNSCSDGVCGAACTGNACVDQAPDPVTSGASVCVDSKGGLSQQCCAADTTRPCFGDRIERVGKATVPMPAWPDPTYPKTAEPVLVDAFCEPATGQNLFDAITTGLPSASAVILPMHACYQDTESCP